MYGGAYARWVISSWGRLNGYGVTGTPYGTVSIGYRGLSISTYRDYTYARSGRL